ncbi:DUF6049 family protein [Amycolatopsis sp. NPDC059021]|uniref:DUF6049 family protein n=1 Tax=Amycolatopsis sp. NPDC059021 TaxID=3346704 RepID=UPI0036716373
MKRFAAFVLVVPLLALSALFGGTAQAQVEQEPPRLRLDITQLNPRVITTSSTTLTISGSITNIGDRRISTPKVRLEVGERLTSAKQFADRLAGAGGTDPSLTDFAVVTQELQPGQTAPVNLTVNLTGGRAAYQLARPGVYPLLVNVNGTPEFGGQARLAAVSTLLPVLGAPGKSAPEKPAKPASVTTLWPIADNLPHVHSAALGGPLTLTDDRLADELGTGGRLNALVTAARTAETDDSRLASSLCFAIDPDLIQTVDAMTRGYQVRVGAGTVEGRGVQAAQDWLAGLRALVAGRCVVPLPFADADLGALTRIRSGSGSADPGLLTKAIGGAATITQLLNVQPLNGVLWPDGTQDDQTLTAMAGGGIRTVLTSSANLQSDEPVTSAVTLTGSGIKAQPVDSLISDAMNGVVNPHPPMANTVMSSSVPAISAQNGLAAIAFRAGLGQSQQQPGAHLVVTPPRHWDAPLSEVSGFLQRVGDYLGSGLVTATDLPKLLSGSASDTASMNAKGDLSSGPDGDVTTALSRINGQAANLQSAMVADPNKPKPVRPEDVIEPVRAALLRGASTTWRGAETAIVTANAKGDLDAISDRITVERPKQTIALASGASPLPVFVSNELPVGIWTRIAFNNNSGLRLDEKRNLFYPAGGGKNEYIPVEALRAGRLSVDVSLSTPTGTPLGSPARFELTSTEYGAITIIVTITAGGALLLLASRRIYRRVKEAKSGRGGTT